MTDVNTEVSGNTNADTKSRCYIFTINNFSVDEENGFRACCEEALWGCYQIEKGENETEHLQGALYYKSARKFTVLKKKFPRAHIEAAKSAKAVAKYVQKEETRVRGPYEFHPEARPSQGARTDLDSIAAACREMTLEQISEDMPSVLLRYSHGINVLHTTKLKDRTEKPKVIWITGPAGCGKTRYAWEYEGGSKYIKDGTQWWNGYTQQDHIIIDDFDGKWPFRDFLKLLDRYPYQGQIKGGYVKINSPIIFITCEFKPHDIYTESENQLAQVLRRIDETIDFWITREHDPILKWPEIQINELA